MVYGSGTYKGFSEIRRINEHNTIYSSDESVGELHSPEAVHEVVYVLISNRLATYYELMHNYTIWDTLKLYEIAMTNAYNKHVLHSIKK